MLIACNYRSSDHCTTPDDETDRICRQRWAEEGVVDVERERELLSRTRVRSYAEAVYHQLTETGKITLIQSETKTGK